MGRKRRSSGYRRPSGGLLPIIIGIAVVGIMAGLTEMGQNSSSNNGSGDTPKLRTADQATKAAMSWAGTVGVEDLSPSSLDQNRIRRNYVLAIDASGSMGDNDSCAPGTDPKFSVVRPAVSEFLNSLGPEDYISLVSFQGEQVQVLVPLGPNRPGVILPAIDSIRPGGGTPIGLTLQSAMKLLEDQAQRQAGYGEYNIVLVTDGAASDKALMLQMLDRITIETPIVIQTVGFCIGRNHALNDPSRVIYRSADNGEALRQGLTAAVAEAADFDGSTFEQLNN